MATKELTQVQIDLIREALTLKEASIKRARVSAKPAFAALYDKEIADLNEVRSALLKDK